MFNQFSFRTRVVIVIYFFQRQFQANTANEVWDRFTHCMQSVHESLSDWGCKLDAAVHLCNDHGMMVNYRQYIRQWQLGTTNKTFQKLLMEALLPDRYGNPPVVYDMKTFTRWRRVYQSRALDHKRLAVEQSRLLAAVKVRRNVRGGEPVKRKPNPKSTPRTIVNPMLRANPT